MGWRGGRMSKLQVLYIYTALRQRCTSILPTLQTIPSVRHSTVPGQGRLWRIVAGTVHPRRNRKGFPGKVGRL